MSTTYPLLDSEKITYGGIFSLKELYEHLWSYFGWHKYDLEEKKYKEKAKPTGKEMEIIWNATKDVDEYSKIAIKVEWIIIGLTDVEVTKDDAKVKMNKGEVEIKVSADLVTDKQDQWEVSPHFRFMKGFYEKYLYKGTIDHLKNQTWKEGWDLFNEIKAFLNLYKYS